MKENFSKIKKIVKEKDNRFWLMIFVVISTLAVFIIWISDFNNIFFDNKTAESSSFDFSTIKNESLSELDQAFQDMSFLMEESINNSESENNSVILGTMMEKNLNEKIEEKNKEIEMIQEESLNQEENSKLKESEESIELLRKKIEELEQKIDNK